MQPEGLHNLLPISAYFHSFISLQLFPLAPSGIYFVTHLQLILILNKLILSSLSMCADLSSNPHPLSSAYTLVAKEVFVLARTSVNY